MGVAAGRGVITCPPWKTQRTVMEMFSSRGRRQVNSLSLSARTYRRWDIYHLRPPWSTTARPQGWWALRPCPILSESLACICAYTNTQMSNWSGAKMMWGLTEGTLSCSLLHWLAAVLHQQPDGGGRCVELAHVIFVYNPPHAAHIRVRGKTLKLKHTHSFTYKVNNSCTDLVKATHGHHWPSRSYAPEHSMTLAPHAISPRRWWHHWPAARKWCMSVRWSSRCQPCTSKCRQAGGQRPAWRWRRCRACSRWLCEGHPGE